MAVQIQMRRDTAANWASANPILASGELALETDTGKFKVGNGTSNWSSLTYTVNEQNAEQFATNAETSAQAAAASEGNAQAAQTAAEAAQTAAEAALDSFDDRYLGAKTSDPTLDNDGDALLAGAVYWNSTNGVLRIWTGTDWRDLAVQFAASDTPPSDPEAGDTWYDSSSGKTYIYYDSFWVEVGGAVVGQQGPINPASQVIASQFFV